MKKITYILFALFYLTLSTKVNASIHFCGGQITEISFFEHNSDEACECGKMTNNSCCEDYSIKCQVNDSNSNIVKSLQLNASFKFVVVIWKLLTFSTYSFELGLNNSTGNGPPLPPLILQVLGSIFLRI
ncbi:MAG: hypothetical protein ACEQSR_13420 [Candidatus Methylacidiphilales bacterium]